MAFAFLVDPGRSLVLSRAFATVTDADLIAHVRRLRGDPVFRSNMRQLADFRDATKVVVSATGVHELAALSPWGHGARRAVVVASDYAYGMARMYQMIREPAHDELEIFRQLDKALDWLGLAHEVDTIAAQLSSLTEPLRSGP